MRTQGCIIAVLQSAHERLQFTSRRPNPNMAAVRRLTTQVSKFQLPLLPRFTSTATSTSIVSRWKTKVPKGDYASVVTVGVIAGVAAFGAWGWRRLLKTERNIVTAACAQTQELELETVVDPAGHVRQDLPNYSLEEVKTHKDKGSRIWVTYGDGVYDITDFVDQHPGGGEKIMLAAGGSLEPFWAVFAAHNTDEVRKMLEEWRIGNIDPADRKKKQAESQKVEGPYANDPKRVPILKVNTNEPFNAETPTILLDNEFLTPNNLFFVRNHLPVPVVDPNKFVLEVQVTNAEPIRLTLEDLKTKFKHYTVTATVQCAGNRRIELAKIKPVKGISWTGGAMGNATWTGVRLRDVLLHAGVKDLGEEYDVIKHVHLEGLDNNHLTGERYGASIPIEKAMDIRGDCILAFKMNGEEIPRDHGYPLRAIVPGTVGARNVKWLTRVAASEKEYNGFWQQRDYKGFSPSIDWNNVDFSTAPAIQELPVQSLICSPQEGSSVDTESTEVHVSGVAWSGGGRGIVRVDVSADGGKTWHVASLGSGKEQAFGRAWAWTLWDATIPLPSKEETELVCKAVDTSYNVQPDTSGPIWNLRGCLSTAWHRVHVNFYAK